MIQPGLKVVGRGLDNNSRLETLRFHSLPNAPPPSLRRRPGSLTASEGFLRRPFHSPHPHSNVSPRHKSAAGSAAFIDAEHALDASYARKLGVSVEDLLISQPDNGEQALEITETLVQSGAIDVLVIDSVAALVPRAENLS